MKNKNRTLALILALSLIISAACVIPYFADGIAGDGKTGNGNYVAYTVDEVKALTTPIPLNTGVIILDKTHSFTSDDYYRLVAAENASSMPVILHPDTLEKDIIDVCQFGTWPSKDNQTAIDALSALANRTADTEYKELAQNVATAIKDDAPSKILEKLATDQAGDKTDGKTDEKTEKPEITQKPTTVVSGGKFSDVDDNAWYATAVNYMASTGILNGYPDGTFKPNQPVTEAEFSVICWHLANITDPLKAATTPYNWTYGDVDTDNGKIHHWNNGKYEFVDHWGACYVYGAYKAHWNSVSPAVSNDFVPNGVTSCNSPVLRGEAIGGIMVLMDDLGMLDTEVKQGTKTWTEGDIPDWYGTWKKLNGVWSNYMDDGKVAVAHDGTKSGEYETSDGVRHTWGSANILKAYNYGVVSGVDESGTCNPAGTLTRAELCQILYNAQLNKPRDLVGRPGTEQHGHVGVG